MVVIIVYIDRTEESSVHNARNPYPVFDTQVSAELFQSIKIPEIKLRIQTKEK
jgi:hypothetical protein